MLFCECFHFGVAQIDAAWVQQVIIEDLTFIGRRSPTLINMSCSFMSRLKNDRIPKYHWTVIMWKYCGYNRESACETLIRWVSGEIEWRRLSSLHSRSSRILWRRLTSLDCGRASPLLSGNSSLVKAWPSASLRAAKRYTRPCTWELPCMWREHCWVLCLSFSRMCMFLHLKKKRRLQVKGFSWLPATLSCGITTGKYQLLLALTWGASYFVFSKKYRWCSSLDLNFFFQNLHPVFDALLWGDTRRRCL